MTIEEQRGTCIVRELTGFMATRDIDQRVNIRARRWGLIVPALASGWRPLPMTPFFDRQSREPTQ